VILALVAASMLSFFEGEVARFSKEERVPTPTIVVTESTGTVEPWAWVGLCAPGFECDTTIYIRRDVVESLGFSAMSLLALHEVLHVKRGDHLGAKTVADMANAHLAIWNELKRRLDPDLLASADTDSKWWRRQWARR
jgi:hypothetical protein